MDASTQQKYAETFYGLHKRGDPLILFNAWDVATAKAIARASPAIATSSGAVAAALGYADGENVPLDLVEGLVSRMTAAVSVPVSIDLEAGYGETPEAAATSVARILKAGAVGINIEDGLFGGKRQLAGPDYHAAKIRAVRDAGRKSGVRLFVNARTDPFLLKFGSPDECLDEAARRAKVYAEAGADGIFVPGLTDLALIEKLVKATPLPVNIMVTQGTPEISDLARLGVQRVSLGPWPMMAAMRVVGQAAATVAEGKQYGTFLQPNS
ncbi:isocitrate lyase/phosphoenolpyruvate mutase family protein [Bradyrhizobium sp. WYCCWR 13023]|uniref:Isocitrate lyase/phosphoenolpyruvate mutase family protein n=1 Tax=Bradyrhizobium zhengyangense TaxID=2911009 RepID=A0A9X1RCF0_9BRAD|nr:MULTISPECIES: isocitrate lyase/phosphoenolpyruvate mutase family protein [Bradyrhizobium]MCG2628818.1 isocitrate lyase/phosphoenolpyruvate mutase family protein [Bradyrhizobium zhengyangense]MCG2645278.1 isocitrate lyase/phosphoenolpyruvate mutase family protein [Bradyrhizobium zhengyangense]MCG2668346.1 isocitrate lyase/phosphoenolpyruvate mutase family protein [Bradyrhizobium zhengyangense]MDA9524144.1 PEP phosphonomutase [Bradyrhizobium sp. CCBAU 11434]